MVRGVAIGSVLLPLLLAFGCAGLLGVQSIGTSEDASAPGADQVSQVPAPVVACKSDMDCESKLPATDPVGCAVAKCMANACVFLAKDEDGDGFRRACRSTFAIDQGAKIDCDDSAPGVVPGTELDCTDGSFSLPGLGECRPGKKRCQDDGAFSACAGVIGKRSPETCDNKDDDCDGTVDNGCACSPGSSRPCGPAQAGTGICKGGTQQCANAMWGACTGAIFPGARACTSAADNDCSGTPDNAEAACRCDGNPAGSTMSCATGMAGVCAAGTRTCNDLGATAAWSACVRNTGPSARNCTSGLDNDCANGVDNGEAGCLCDGSPQGTVGACSTGLQGVCAAGTRVCNVSAGGASWSACSQTTPAGPRDCSSSIDNDCIGGADNTQIPCKCGTLMVGQSQACMLAPGEPGTRDCISLGMTAVLDVCQ
jgi:hypothetical protein